MLSPDLSNDAQRFLKKRDSKQFIQIFKAITELCDDPRQVDSIAMGNNLHFRKDVGEFRIVYSFDKSTLRLAIIGNRNDSDAYKQFDRKK
jgi:mRNA interferase RelE/StbE